MSIKFCLCCVFIRCMFWLSMCTLFDLCVQLLMCVPTFNNTCTPIKEHIFFLCSKKNKIESHIIFKFCFFCLSCNFIYYNYQLILLVIPITIMVVIPIIYCYIFVMLFLQNKSYLFSFIFGFNNHSMFICFQN
jgi:hypothetical protein